MAFNLRNSEVERLAETVACLADELDEIALECAAMPPADPRSAEEIIGFNSVGLPG